MKQECLYNTIEEISQKLDLRKSTIIDFLCLVSHHQNLSSKILVRKLSIPKTHLYRLIHEFTNILEPDSKDKSIYIKKDLRNNIMKNLELLINQEKKFDNSKAKNILSRYNKIRPKPDRKLDQFNATISTTLKRVEKLFSNGDLVDKNIALLGDDDLVSVAIGSSHKCKKISVFEIDRRLNDFITKISNDNNLNIEIIHQNLFGKIDKKYLEDFDIIFTDPPYTPQGINIFLNQAVKLIKKSFQSRIYLCYGNSDRAREREIEIQKLILEHHLIINSKIPFFNKYIGAESIGSQSSLYILDWTPRAKTVNINSNKLYTHE